MTLAPELVALLKKMGQDDLNDLGQLLVPAIVAEVEALSPAGVQATEALIFAAIEPAMQAALASILAKVIL